MSNRYLIVADAVKDLNPVFDLGVCLSRELLLRGVEVDYLDLYSHNPDLSSGVFLETLPVRRILDAPEDQQSFWRLGPQRAADANDYCVILQRTDPPVNERFIAHTRHFEAVGEQVVQINRPPATYELSEHTVALDFPDYAAPTVACESFDELVEAVRSFPGEVVLKPENTYCGIGVTFTRSDVQPEELREFWETWQPHVIVQPYLEAIESSGDLRILTINDIVLGSVLRVPQEGSRLANLHQGARAVALAPSERQLAACREVAAALNPKGLYLLGLDFIGEDLTEINFTSPTTIVQINQVNNIRADVALVDELERMCRRGPS